MLDRRSMLAAIARAALALSALAPNASAQDGKPRARRQAQLKKAVAGAGGLRSIDPLIEESMRAAGVVGASLAVGKDGRLIKARGYGLADFENKRPATRATLFSLASVTKSVSAITALQLVDEGKLDIEIKLVDLFHDLKPAGMTRPADPRFHAITVHHLMYHAAGLPHDIARGPGARIEQDDDEDDESDDLIRVYQNAFARRLDFDPGSEHRYSNAGFLLLRLVIEKIVGRPYEPYVREHLLAPLGITRTILERSTLVPGETRRYINGPKGLREAGHKPSNWLATPSDMVKLMAALDGMRGRPLLSKPTRRLMLEPPPPPVRPNERGAYVGLGWDVVQRDPNGFRYGKDGGKAGVRAWLEHLPGGVDWCLMFNTTPGGRNGQDKPPDRFRPCVNRVREALEATRDWPARDLFETP